MLSHVACLKQGIKGNVFRIVFASMLAFGLVETGSAASCLLGDVTIGGMDASACGWGSSNDTVGMQPQPDSWAVNVAGAGDTFGELVWNAYYKVEIIETGPSTSAEWSDPSPTVADGFPIDLKLTSFTGSLDDPFSSGTFTVDGRSPGGELLIVLKDGSGAGSDYHWYLFLDKLGDDLAGTWDTTVPFGGKNLSHMTAYEIGVSPGGGEPPALIPVPAAVWLFGSGLLGLVGVARRRKY